MIDKNQEALKQQPLFKEEKLEEQQRLSYNPVFQNPLNAMQGAGEPEDEDDDQAALLEELRDEVGEVVQKEAKPLKQEMKRKEDSKQGVNAEFKARRKEIADSHKNKTKNTKSKVEKLSENAYASLLSSMTSSAEMEKNELKRFAMNPDVKKLKAEHKIKMRTRVIKHAFKKDEEITERIVENKEEKVATKKDNAALLSDNDTMVKDALVKLRRDVDINDKKGMTYPEFETISAFGLKMEKGGLSKLSSLYGEGERIPKGNSTLDKESTTYAALNMMTAEIMKLDESIYDVHTDEALVKQSGELSAMSLMVGAYQGFLSKHPDYLDYLAKQKGDNGSMADQMYKKIIRLSAIGQYYRLRKLVLEDPYYIEHANEEIPLTEEKGDSIQVKRLKKMMLASAQAASNLQNIFGAVKVPDIRLKSGKHADMLGALTMSSIADISEFKDDEKVKNIKLMIDSLAASNQIVKTLESESFFQAPVWLQNALTLDPETIKKKKPDPNYGLSSILTASVDLHLPKLMEKVGCKQQVIDKEIHDSFNKRKVKYGKLSQESFDKRWKKEGGPIQPLTSDYVWKTTDPKFLDATDEAAGNLTLSDNWQRQEFSFSGAYAYKRTNEEMMEMIDTLKIQDNKEEWEKGSADKEIRAFYESAYKEAARKLLFSEYAGARRLNETVCVKMLALHPTDLLYQASPELHATILQTATITNSFVKGQKEKIKRLFAEDTEGNYAFDSDEAQIHADMSSAENLKLTYLMTELSGILTCSYDGHQDICRKLYGNANIYNDKILPAFRKAKAENHPLTSTISEGKASDVAWWYLSTHPEMIDKKILHKKVNGKFVLQLLFNSANFQMLSSAEEKFRNGLKNGIAEVPGNEELDKYQDYLQKEGYPKTRTENNVEYDEGDEAVKETEIEPESVTKLAGCKDKVLTGAEIRKNRREDPYSLNLIRNQLSELVYKDDTGKERVNSASAL